ncbi:hypothetical protein F153LOC_09495 [Lelliottia sp. F153]|nr:hypothetical protein DAI21_07060 [Lelliottia sp. WB101]PKA32617.1 hypothetical protein CWR41_11065 [Cedecea lapagei]PLY43689.1 hypothetical protein F159LOC_18230 [Lelliottia sp. F159]PLY51998.1 hypothetical protein F154LOC_05540 [Lelliottia sp. F154]PLY55361.1 hypothetical protein F153LOC_09495 [Lelliottia sp. F153]UQC72738.1 hypothetical protein C0560_18885 [Lelliottia sp. AC1]
MSVGPENSVITERLLAATAMKTSRYIQNITATGPWASQMICYPSQEQTQSLKNRTKVVYSLTFGQKIG